MTFAMFLALMCLCVLLSVIIVVITRRYPDDGVASQENTDERRQ